MLDSSESTASSGDILERIAAATAEEPVEAPVVEERAEAPVVEEGHASEEETLPPAEEQDEADEQPETEEQEVEAESQDGAEGDDPYELSTDDFAEMLGIEGSALTIDDESGEVLLQTKVGEEKENVPLKELIKSYQTDKYVTQKSQAVSEEKKAFEAEKIDYVNQVTERLNDAAATAQILEQQLLADFQSVDWDGLKVTSPGEYAARRQDFADRQNSLVQAKQQLAQQAQQVAQQVAQEQQAAVEADNRQRLVEEKESLLTAIPEWRDDAVAAKEYAAMSDHITQTYGISAKEVDDITDHRALLVMRDAMLYRQGKEKTTAAEKKIRSLPKISRPGKNQKPKNPRAEQSKKARVRLRKSGKPRDAVPLLMDYV